MRFDKDCTKLKQEVRSVEQEKFREPHEKLKQFKTKCRSKRFFFWQNKLKEIEDSLKGCKTFWNKWKNAKKLDTLQSKQSNITGNQWFSHFSILPTEKCDKELEECSHPKTPQKLKYEINEPFTKKEFMNVIRNLKNGKASGFDTIFNEMLKNSLEFILDLLHKFINLYVKP